MTNLTAGILAIGVVRFPALYARMHAATKAPTLGLVLVAGAAALTVTDSRGKLLPGPDPGMGH
jgi:monovalent cation/proton antiporter MnhG/PhaG subunit